MASSWDFDLSTQIIAAKGERTDELVRRLEAVVKDGDLECRDVIVNESDGHMVIDVILYGDGYPDELDATLKAFSEVTTEAASVFEDEDDDPTWYIGTEEQIAVSKSKDTLDRIMRMLGEVNRDDLAKLRGELHLRLA